jgi:hypothetical protein
MNSRLSVSLLVFSFGLAVVPARAETELETSMKQMSKALKQLSLDLQQPKDASKADYLALTGTLKTAAQHSRGLTPKKVATIPPDKQAAMEAAYQKAMDDLVASIDTLTADIQADKWDDAAKEITVIKQQETQGHKTFRIKK